MIWEIIVKINKFNFGKYFLNYMVYYGVLLKYVVLLWLVFNGVINIFWLDIYFNVIVFGIFCFVRYGLNIWLKGVFCNFGYKVFDWVLYVCYKLLFF